MSLGFKLTAEPNVNLIYLSRYNTKRWSPQVNLILVYKTKIVRAIQNTLNHSHVYWNPHAENQCQKIRKEKYD